MSDVPADEPLDEPLDGPLHEPGRLVLLVTPVATPPGALSWPAWQALREATLVAAADMDPRWEQALADAGVPLQAVTRGAAGDLARRLLATVVGGESVVWLVSPDGDRGLAEALTAALARGAAPGAQVEVLVGGWDPPGARLLELVEVMDRLRSPGGCPWDAAQTHASLVPYALEEAFELAEAVEAGDRTHLREELGDLLLQVVFHARVAAEHVDEPFDVDDVAEGIVTKLRRRHPHVFADGAASTPEEVEASWHEIKAAEKQRESVLDGVPLALPALARADKVLGRVERVGAPVPEPEQGPADAAAVGDRLLALVVAARRGGVDAEAALRRAVRDLERRAREHERRP
ncbi:nucleoside triphosphate pyrophosphohydrolase [Thalassiella azotivora]